MNSRISLLRALYRRLDFQKNQAFLQNENSDFEKNQQINLKLF